VLSARFKGDDEYAGAEVVDLAFDVGKDTPALTLLVPPEVDAGQPLTGALVAVAAGEPLVLAGQLRVAARGGEFTDLFTVPTDEEGRFSAHLRASRFAPGDVTLAAEYLSTTPWRRGARTAPVTVKIAEPRPVPVLYLIGAFALTCAAVLGFALARTRPWIK